MTPQPQPAPKVTLEVLAIRALRQFSGDRMAAVADLTKRLRRDRKLLTSIIQDVVEQAARSAINHSILRERARIVQAVEHGPSAGRQNVVALANIVAVSLLDMPLSSGVRLGDASYDQIMESAKRYQAIAQDTGHKARFLFEVANKVPAGKLVRDVLTAAEAKNIWDTTS